MRVVNFGPKSIILNETFNTQPNGDSAMWFDINGLDDYSNVVVIVDGNIFKSSRNNNIISVLIPQNFITKVKNILIEVFDEKNPSIVLREILEVKNKISNNLFEYTKKPNFFLIGFPRSGTTTLYWRLLEHQNIYLSRIKEPFYFDDRAKGIVQNIITNDDEYMSLFKYAHTNAKIIGEATTSYISSKETLLKIKEFNKDAKILVIVRNPILASISFYLMHKKGGINDTASTFEKAWRDGMQSYNRTLLNNYPNIFKVGDHIEEAILIFGKNLKIVFHDDLEKDSAKLVEDILQFLKLPIDKFSILQKSNSAKWNNNENIVSQELLEEMKEYFLPQIQKLSKLTNRDLNSWIQI
jgi:hypothetical protein